MGQRRITITFGGILLIFAARNYNWSRKSIQRDLLRKTAEDKWDPKHVPTSIAAPITKDVDRELEVNETTTVQPRASDSIAQENLNGNTAVPRGEASEEPITDFRPTVVLNSTAQRIMDSGEASNKDPTLTEDSDISGQRSADSDEVKPDIVPSQEHVGTNETSLVEPLRVAKDDIMKSDNGTEVTGVTGLSDLGSMANQSMPQQEVGPEHRIDDHEVAIENDIEPFSRANVSHHEDVGSILTNVTTEQDSEVGFHHVKNTTASMVFQDEANAISASDNVTTGMLQPTKTQSTTSPNNVKLPTNSTSPREVNKEKNKANRKFPKKKQSEKNATDIKLIENKPAPRSNDTTISNSTDDSFQTNPTHSADEKPKEIKKANGEVSAGKQQEKKTKAKSKIRKKSKGPSPIPNVLIAGVQKGGTTAIAHYLKDTQGACFSNPAAAISQGEGKESHFFDNWKTYNSSGLEYYEQVFKHCEGNNLIVDGTPEFMKTGQRIFDTYTQHGSLDKLKIIISLREPVEREISWYNHRLRDCPGQMYARPVCNAQTGETVPFVTVAQKELAWRLSNNETKNVYGVYEQYLKTFFNLFDRNNILILSYEEAKTDQKRLLQRIHKFLGLKGKPKALPVVNSDHRQHEMPPCDVQRALAKRFEPFNEKLYRLLEENPGPVNEQKPFPRFSNKCVEEDHPVNEADPFLKSMSKHIIPNVLFAGAQQTIVTALSEYSAAMMGGCLPSRTPRKANETEYATHFFDNSNQFKKGLSFYESFFDQCSNNGTAVIDATADLILYPRRVKEIYALQGKANNVKMIFLLRDPIHREIESFHIQAEKCGTDPSSGVCSKGGKATSLEPYIETNVISKLESKKFDYMVSLYAQYLKVWFDVWDRKQILILRYEELQNKPKKFLARIHAFLGIKSPVSPQNLKLTGPTKESPCEIREKMSSYFEQHNKALYKLLDSKPGPKVEERPFPKFETHKCSS